MEPLELSKAAGTIGTDSSFERLERSEAVERRKRLKRSEAAGTTGTDLGFKVWNGSIR
jgi:hypothetical protein